MYWRWRYSYYKVYTMFYHMYCTFYWLWRQSISVTKSKFQIILSCHLIQIHDPLILLLLRRRITWSPPKWIFAGKKLISETNVFKANETNLIFADSFYMYFDGSIALLWIKILPVHKYNDINYFNYFSMSKDLLGKTLNDID